MKLLYGEICARKLKLHKATAINKKEEEYIQENLQVRKTHSRHLSEHSFYSVYGKVMK